MEKGSIDMKKFVALVITVLLLQGCGAKRVYTTRNRCRNGCL